MKINILLSILLLTGLVVSACTDTEPGGGQQPSGYSIATNGRMLTVTAFQSTNLGNSRNIRIYLPAGYTGSTNSFPVLYLHDGQNVFSPGGPYGCWNVETTADNLTAAGRIREILMVGIDNNSDRIAEYTPSPDASYGGGNGENYIKFLVHELLPWVSSNFRAKTGPQNTAIMGSSLGGLISFYAATTRPDTFGMAGCLSSSFWWDSRKLLTEFENSSVPLSGTKFWIDSGNAEGSDSDGNGVSSMAEDAIRAAAKLRQLGHTYGQDLLLDIDIPAGHNEAAWAARVHKPLLFFFGQAGTVSITNLKVQTSAPEIDATGTVPEVCLFTTAYYDNGVIATVPLTDLGITSSQSDLFNIASNGYISLKNGVVTEETNINFTVSYAGHQAACAIQVFPTLSSNVSLDIEVSTPDTSGNTIYMVGNHSAIGSWNPASGFQLHLKSSGSGSKTYTNRITLPRNSSLEFKFCSGTAWSYEELNGSGSPIGNRTITVNSSSNHFTGQVLQWRAVP